MACSRSYPTDHCWLQAFGSTASLEAAYFRETGKQQLLSEQQLMDCDWTWDEKHSAQPCPFTSWLLQLVSLGSKFQPARSSGRPSAEPHARARYGFCSQAGPCKGGKEPHACHGGCS